MVNLRVSSNNYKADLSLERRITYIRGDSGSGKTGLVNVINDYNGGDDSIIVDCDREIDVINSIRTLDTLDGYKGKVVFIDDSITTENKKFGCDLAKYLLKNDIYMVIINRVDVPIKPGKSKKEDNKKDDDDDSGLDYSVSSILICKSDGINHYFENREVIICGSTDVLSAER